MKYFYSIGMSLLIVVLLRVIFSYFNYDGEFLIGWFGCMTYYITLEYNERNK